MISKNMSSTSSHPLGSFIDCSDPVVGEAQLAQEIANYIANLPEACGKLADSTSNPVAQAAVKTVSGSSIGDWVAYFLAYPVMLFATRNLAAPTVALSAEPP